MNNKAMCVHDIEIIETLQNRGKITYPVLIGLCSKCGEYFVVVKTKEEK